MKLALPRDYARKVWRAVVEFDLLEEGDRVLVGFSGGKDSSFLLYALKVLQNSAPFRFDLGAVHVDLGFEQLSDVPHLEEFCRQLDVPLTVQKTQIAEIALRRSRNNPCASCAYFRRAVVNEIAAGQGYNKVAYAHHNDDAVETFLMSQLYSGKIQTFLPKSYLDRTNITVIRPLVYLREAEISEFVQTLQYAPMPSPCPFQGKTYRHKVKELIESLTGENPFVYTNLAAAMRRDALGDLWPPAASREEMRQKHQRTMRPAAGDDHVHSE